jgi:hypothetical protein
VLLVEVLMVPAAALLYDLPMWDVICRSVVLFLGTFGFVTLGTFYAAMASRLRAREVLLPLLLFPMLVPLLVAAVQATGAILNGDLMGQLGSWIRLLIVFDVIFFLGTVRLRARDRGLRYDDAISTGPRRDARPRWLPVRLVRGLFLRGAQAIGCCCSRSRTATWAPAEDHVRARAVGVGLDDRVLRALRREHAVPVEAASEARPGGGGRGRGRRVPHGMTLALGSIWGRPTWGIWWTWDPRLTTTAILLLIYVGYLALRAFTEDEDRRARWSAAVGILGFLNVPIVYMSVRWWRTIHQVQSTPDTVDPNYVLSLRLNAFAFLFLFIFFVGMRYYIARLERARAAHLEEDSTGGGKSMSEWFYIRLALGLTWVVHGGYTVLLHRGAAAGRHCVEPGMGGEE